jgi:hypothetical protein
MWMGLDVAGIDHQPFKVGLVDHLLQQLFPDALVAPAAETAMGVFPVPVVRRQIALRRTGAQNPQNAVEKTPVVLGDTAPMTSLSGKMRAEQFPGVVAQVVTVIRGGWHHLQPSSHKLQSRDDYL